MARKSWPILLVLLAAVPVAAADLSGRLSTSFALGRSFTAWNTLELRLSFSRFELQSLSTWQGVNLTAQAFRWRGDFGNLAIQAGVTLQPWGPPRLGVWTAQEFRIVSSFVALELNLGSLRLEVLLQAGPAAP
ncbi:MAG: hypothetical protein N2507_01975 [Candidatus Bipolaricaulota bacterium]|nr:hypothetical protein [Candidatus Bipolaricaulota bacterium]